MDPAGSVTWFCSIQVILVNVYLLCLPELGQSPNPGNILCICIRIFGLPDIHILYGFVWYIDGRFLLGILWGGKRFFPLGATQQIQEVMIFENSDWTDLTSTVKHTVTLDSYTDAELMANGVWLGGRQVLVFLDSEGFSGVESLFVGQYCLEKRQVKRG